MLKRFSLIILCFIFSIFFAYTKQPNVEFIPVMTIPVTNKTIVIDAGHGSPDERSRK